MAWGMPGAIFCPNPTPAEGGNRHVQPLQSAINADAVHTEARDQLRLFTDFSIGSAQSDPAALLQRLRLASPAQPAVPVVRVLCRITVTRNALRLLRNFEMPN